MVLCFVNPLEFIESIKELTNLLHEYKDLFATKFIEMKGIAGELSEMRIPLRAYAKPVDNELTY